jgi:hypothetical protein
LLSSRTESTPHHLPKPKLESRPDFTVIYFSKALRVYCTKFIYVYDTNPIQTAQIELSDLRIGSQNSATVSWWVDPISAPDYDTASLGSGNSYAVFEFVRLLKLILDILGEEASLANLALEVGI